MYRLTCPCGHDLIVAPRQAGATITCDACQRPVDVPKLGDLRQLPRAETTAPATAESAPRGLGGVRGTTFALCLLLALGAGTFSLVAAIKGFSRQLPPTVDGYIALHRTEIDQMPPHELVSLWEEYVQNGLGAKITPYFLRQRRNMIRWRIGFGVALTITVAAAAGATLAGRRRPPIATET